jgi:hypothetical protein
MFGLVGQDPMKNERKDRTGPLFAVGCAICFICAWFLGLCVYILGTGPNKEGEAARKAENAKSQAMAGTWFPVKQGAPIFTLDSSGFLTWGKTGSYAESQAISTDWLVGGWVHEGQFCIHTTTMDSDGPDVCSDYRLDGDKLELYSKLSLSARATIPAGTYRRLHAKP